ncbi:MAG: hypothetical protein JWP03_1751, partial [Phycisphaerales bacterium]|nr:hypothetical protein [Phycisphaerales bacterium]
GGEARRAKLFYLRDRVGKSVRLAEKRKEKRSDKPATEPSAQNAELAASAT